MHWIIWHPFQSHSSVSSQNLEAGKLKTAFPRFPCNWSYRCNLGSTNLVKSCEIEFETLLSGELRGICFADINCEMHHKIVVSSFLI